MSDPRRTLPAAAATRKKTVTASEKPVTRYKRCKSVAPFPPRAHGPWYAWTGIPAEELGTCKGCGDQLTTRSGVVLKLSGFGSDPQWKGAVMHMRCGRIISIHVHPLDIITP
jgi:hypothetical protein